MARHPWRGTSRTRRETSSPRRRRRRGSLGRVHPRPAREVHIRGYGHRRSRRRTSRRCPSRPGRSRPRFPTMMFEGLTSRCTMSWACAWLNASAMPRSRRSRFARKGHGSRPWSQWARIRSSGIPSSHSSTRYGLVSCRARESSSVTIDGWVSRTRTSSCWIRRTDKIPRCTDSAGPNPRLRSVSASSGFLIATWRPIVVSSPWYSRDIPPRIGTLFSSNRATFRSQSAIL